MPPAPLATLLRSSWARAALALLATALALVVAWPGPPRARTSWDDLIAPYARGREVTRSYRLAAPSRGEEHDISVVARREPGPAGPAGHVQIHVLDRGRWKGIRESRSFGIAYEVPRSSASRADCEAVTEALAQAVRAHDPGFPSIAAIALTAEPPAPWLARALDRARTARHVVIVLALALAACLVLTLPGGAWILGALLAALGLVLRAAQLGLPFWQDQDVQRLMTAHAPLWDIVTGVGLRDRHPPLYFVLLHLVQSLGQAEWIVRAPAAVAGAATAPLLLWAVARVRGAVGPLAAVAALMATLSPELIARSREVSEIPLFALLLLVSCAALLRLTGPARTGGAWVAFSHAAALWTYYLAPIILPALWAPLALARQLDRRAWRAGALGLLLGAPALVLGLVIFARDLGARRVAAALPSLAWGQRTAAEMLRDVGRVLDGALGPGVIYLLLAILVLATLRRRDVSPWVPWSGGVAAVLGLLGLVAVARLQPYYVAVVVPLFLFSLGLCDAALEGRRRRAATAALATAALVALGLTLDSGARAYVRRPDAFMPDFVSVIAARPEREIATVAHYDAHLLTYYLARRFGAPVDWLRVDAAGGATVPRTGRRVVPLAHAHAQHEPTGQDARRRLEQELERGPLLVIDRFAFRLPAVAAALARCTEIAEAPVARLLACPAAPRRGPPR